MGSVRTEGRMRRAGAAYVEALIILPIFILCWVGLFFSLNRFSKTQHMQMKARQCLWTYAYRGCQNAAAECEGAQPKENRGFFGVGADNDKLGGIERIGGILDGILSAVFGGGGELSPSAKVSRPSLLGGGHVEYGGDAHRQYFMCNPKEFNPMDILVQTFESVVEGAF